MGRMRRWQGLILSVMLAAGSLQMPIYAAEAGETAETAVEAAAENVEVSEDPVVEEPAVETPAEEASAEETPAEEESEEDSDYAETDTERLSENELTPEQIRAFQDKVKIWKYENRITIVYDSKEDIQFGYSIYSGVTDELLYSEDLKWDEESGLYYEVVDFDAVNELNKREDDDFEEIKINDTPVKIVLDDGQSRFEEIVSQNIDAVVIESADTDTDGQMSVKWSSSEKADGYSVIVSAGEEDNAVSVFETDEEQIDLNISADDVSDVIVAPYNYDDDSGVNYYGEAALYVLKGSDPEQSEELIENVPLEEAVSTDAEQGMEEDSSDEDWISYPDGELYFDECYTAFTNKAVTVSATWVSEEEPQRFSWKSSDDSAVFSGTSFVPPEITGEENTWWISVMVGHANTGVKRIQLSVNGKSASTDIEVQKDESGQTEWRYISGNIQGISDGGEWITIDGKNYATSDSYTARDAQSALNALTDTDTNIVIASLCNGKLFHIRSVKEAIEPVVEIKAPKEGICWSDGKYLTDAFNLEVTAKYKSMDTSVFSDRVIQMANPTIKMDSLQFETASNIIQFEKQGLFDSGQTYRLDLDSNQEISFTKPFTGVVPVKMNEKQAPADVSESVYIKVSCKSSYFGTVQCEDVVLEAGNTDLAEENNKTSQKNLSYSHLQEELQKKLSASDRKAIVALDSNLYSYFTEDQVTEIRDFLSVYISEILEADKIGDLPCLSWMPKKAREKVKGKIFGKLGVKETVLPKFKSGEAEVEVEGTTLQGDTKKVKFVITYSEYAMGYSANPYSAYGQISYEIDGKEGIGNVCFANLESFRKTMLDFVQIAYDQSWGKSADSVAAMFVSEPINKLLGGKYSSRLYKLMKKNAEKSVKKVSFHCPIDVFVYDSGGKLCGSVEEDKVTKMDGLYISLREENGEIWKDVFLSGDDYSIRVAGRKTGFMYYSVTEYEAGTKVHSYGKQKIPIEFGKTYDCFIPCTIGIDPAAYALDGGFGEIIQIAAQQEPDPLKITEEKCGDNCILTIDPNTLTATVSGSGPMWDKEFSIAAYRPEIRNLVIEEGVTYIGANAFASLYYFDARDDGSYEFSSKNSYLVAVEIADSVTEIGYRAFAGQRNLASLSIGSGLKTFDGNDFLGCENLRNIYVNSASPYLMTGEDQVLYSKDQKTLFLLPYGVEEYIGPDGLERVGELAGDNLPTLKRITLPQTVNELGRGAFWKCESLEKVSIFSKKLDVKSYHGLKVDCFEKCDRIQTIGPLGEEYDFELLPEEIPFGLFANMGGLKEVVFGEGVKQISGGIFCGSPDISYIRIPESAEYIGNPIAGDCPLLKTCGPTGGGYDIEFGWKAHIPAGTFSGLSSLEKVVIPEGVESVGMWVFSSCENLEKVILPGTLKSIINENEDEEYYEAKRMFANCPKLKSIGPAGGGYNVEFGWTNEIPADMFHSSEYETIVLPEELKTIYKLTFYKSSVRNVVFPGTIETIEKNAFAECRNLESAALDETNLKKLDVRAFSDCSGLKNVRLPENMEVIGERAFGGCKALEEIKMPSQIDEMGGSVFYDCQNLTSIILPENLQVIGEYCFQSCSSLGTVVCPKEAVKIEKNAFAGCSSLKTIEIPAGVTAIGYYAFSACRNLESITMSNKLKTISFSAFSDCDSLSDVYYKGTENDWTSVWIDIENEPLKNAQIHYMDANSRLEDALVKGIVDKVYTGSEITQNLTISIGSKTLKSGTDYIVSYDNNINVGTAELTITGKGSYEGTITRTFLIRLGKTARGDMFNLASNVKVEWKAVPGAKYYKVYRSGVKDPVIVTTGLVGWDKTAGLENGRKYTYKIVASLTGKGDSSGDSPLSYSKVMYRLKTVVIRSVKNNAPGKVTVKYDKTTAGDSYVLQYCERQDMVGAKTKVVLGANNTSYTIGGLKKGKTYYISIRVRKKVNGIDYYTTFGVPKKVTITR